MNIVLLTPLWLSISLTQTIGNKRRPVCKRCEKKRLDCKPVQRRAVFRHGSSANLDASFSGGQVWVNSKPRNWKSTKKTSTLDTPASTQTPPSWPTGDSRRSISTFGEDVPGNQAVIESLSPINSYATRNDRPESDDVLQGAAQHQDLQQVHGDSPGISRSLNLLSSETAPTSLHGIEFPPGHESVAIHQEKFTTELDSIRYSDYHSLTVNNTATNRSGDSPSSNNEFAAAAREKLQEACLLRYFIEELSPWVRSYLYPCAAIALTRFSLITVTSFGISNW